MKSPSSVCPQCGTLIPSGSSGCSRCSSPATREEPPQASITAAASPHAPEDGTQKAEGPEEIFWEINVPLLTDQFIMYDLLKVWGISSLILFLIMTAIFIYERNWRNFFNVLPVLGLVSLGILALFILVMLVYFGNRFPMGFGLGPQGALATSLSRRGRWGNRLAVILGALAGKPGLAGSGLLAMARESVGVSWDEVRRIKVHSKARVISLMDSWHVAVRLYCTPKNYDIVLQSVQKWAATGLRKAAEARPERGLSPGLRLGLKSLSAAVAAFLITALPLEVPPLLIWLLLAAGLWCIWFLVFRRFFAIVALALAGVILLGFVSQSLEVHQRTNPEEFRKFAESRGVKIDKVPDWIIGKYRRYERFYTHEWVQIGIGTLGLSFFVWVSFAALLPRRRKGPGTKNPHGSAG